jgi:hypothetical protein
MFPISGSSAKTRSFYYTRLPGLASISPSGTGTTSLATLRFLDTVWGKWFHIELMEEEKPLTSLTEEKETIRANVRDVGVVRGEFSFSSVRVRP